MSFSEAVKSGFDHYVKFDGRAARPAFWWWYLFEILVVVGAYIVDAILDTGFFYFIAVIGLLLPTLSVAIRRLHDTDRTGWWILIGFVPLIGFIVLLIFYLEKSNPGDNKYGPDPQGGVSGSGVAAA
ncbi:MAG: DUF805 domain-containing protein [Actinobacteria bacterium]|nr:DUF805 domain-containing protein [Actinomycetota bacterium]